MGSKRFPSVLFMMFMALVSSSSQAHNFIVGGKDGWVLDPSENFNHWAERHRFRVNDTLLFRFKKGEDSVLVVTKEDYYACNNKAPIQCLTEGESVFKFDRSGPFFFISGNVNKCQNGQKLIVVVLAVRNKRPGHDQGPVLVPSLSPSSGGNPSDFNKAPPPPQNKNSGSMQRFGRSDVGFVFSISIALSVVFHNLI